MENLLCELENMGIKNHFLAYFANKTWGGGALPRLKAFAEKIKWEVVAEPNEATGAMKPSDVEQCEAIAEAMVQKLKEVI
ncbi:MAG: FprA family A-type flavoprotein, partial [Odoribacter sp.]|nr:FprA family A-type flavoprotein [Odoribacter sp.]